jgi:hypothetical protein
MSFCKSKSLIISGFTKAIISLQACIIYTLSTQSIDVIKFSNVFILSINNSLLLNLAQGLEADNESAAATIHQIGLINGISK